VARWLSGGRPARPIARHPDAHGHAAGSPTSFGHRFAIVCLRGLQSQRKCRNPREHGDVTRAHDSAANRKHSPVEDPRLKIVVSPVRVRVSPSDKGLLNQGCAGRRIAAAGPVGLFGPFQRPPTGKYWCRDADRHEIQDRYRISHDCDSADIELRPLVVPVHDINLVARGRAPLLGA
jgi:hypothetical protein